MLHLVSDLKPEPKNRLQPESVRGLRLNQTMRSVSDLCLPPVGDAVLCAAEPTVDPSIANCDFENGLCLYYQERAESKVWTRMSVQPNAYRTGDHTTGAGEWTDGRGPSGRGQRHGSHLCLLKTAEAARFVLDPFVFARDSSVEGVELSRH